MGQAAAKGTPILSALKVLRKLSPPKTLIHVGAGLGMGEMHAWQQWEIPNAWIIDANHSRLQWAEVLADTNSNWHVVSAILSDTESAIEYHHTSNPDEDSTLSPSYLTSIWPNLQSTVTESTTARRLDKLLQATGSAAPGLWLFIDCLPALPIINGAGELLETCSAIWARTLLRPMDAAHEAASLESLESKLQPLGFRCIEIVESNHPAIGHTLFVRDWSNTLQPRIVQLRSVNALQHQLLAVRHDEVVQLTRKHEVQIAALEEAKIRQAELALDRQTILDTLAQQNATLTSSQAELQLKLEAANAEHIQHNSEHEARVANLIQARDEQARLATERLQQMEMLTQQAELGETRQPLDAVISTNQTLESEQSALVSHRDQPGLEVDVLAQPTEAFDEQGEPVAIRRAEKRALENEQAINNEDIGSRSSSKKVILVAGIPRSGSTWVYNCIRLILIYKYQSVYSCWIDDYDPDNPCDIHLVKIHDPDDIPAHVDEVYTSRRDIRDVAASIKRMGWDNKANFIRQLDEYIEKYHKYWVLRTRFEVEFSDIRSRPLALVETMGHSLGAHLDGMEAKMIFSKLVAISPGPNYDKRTLLHPHHISENDASYAHFLGEDMAAQITNRYQDWLRRYLYLSPMT